MKNIRLRPTLANSANDCMDLLIGKHPSGGLSESRHGRAGNSSGSRAKQDRVVGNGKINRIVEVDGRPAFSIDAVAACAILPIQRAEIGNFARSYRRVSDLRPPGRASTAERSKSKNAEDSENQPSQFHFESPRGGFSSLNSAASTPARIRNGSN